MRAHINHNNVLDLTKGTHHNITESYCLRCGLTIAGPSHGSFGAIGCSINHFDTVIKSESNKLPNFENKEYALDIFL